MKPDLLHTQIKSFYSMANGIHFLTITFYSSTLFSIFLFFVESKFLRSVYQSIRFETTFICDVYFFSNSYQDFNSKCECRHKKCRLNGGIIATENHLERVLEQDLCP